MPGLTIPIPEWTAQGASLISLLEAAGHDPNALEDSSDEDDDSSSTPLTPNDSQHHLSSHPYHYDSSDNHHPSSVSGRATSREDLAKGLRRHELVTELALDSLDAAHAAVERAQLSADPESFEEPEGFKGFRDDKSPESKLATIVEEFGPWTDESEVFVGQIPGALFRGILIKGLIALTNRRLFVYAFIPHPEQNKVIRAGPVTTHFPGLLTKKRRVWFELKADSVTWYRDSTKVFKPLGACRLSGANAVLPYDPEHPYSFRVQLIDGRTKSFDVDTAESAIGWTNDMIAALFTFRATADKLRLSLPLQYITGYERGAYLGLAERVCVKFNVDVCTSSGEIVNEAEEDPAATQTIEMGWLKSHSDFSDSLKQAIDDCQDLPICSGAKPILELDSEARTVDTEAQDAVAADKSLPAQFVRMFALEDRPADLYLAASVELVRALPAWGSLVISKGFLCFWRKSLVGADIKLKIPLVDIDDVTACKAFGFRIFGLAVQVHGAADVRFDFHSRKVRDEVVSVLKQAAIDSKKSSRPSSVALEIRTSDLSLSDSRPSFSTSGSSTPSSPITLPPFRSHFEAAAEHTHVFGQKLDEDIDIPAGMAKVPISIIGASGRTVRNQHFVCLTIGSRGDVQPYIALGIELLKNGNRVTIASHPEYRAWVESYGIGFRDVGGDPGALMVLVTQHPLFSPGFFKESLLHFRDWLDTLFSESFAACLDADILIESPSTMAGIHVAEALGIPYFRAFTMPWTATSAYPHAFASSVDLGPTANLLSYSIFENVMWKATSGQINRWRKNELGLAPTSLHKMSQRKVPFMYNFSTAVVPRPNDYRDSMFISGYWYLDSSQEWTPPAGLLDFIARARAEGKPVVYIGFGSIIVPDAANLTKSIVQAVLNSDVRAILSKGWSDRGNVAAEEPTLPSEIFPVASIAHDRLFPMIDAAMHHGGAGTTGASLRAGLPTLIHPFFGDQYFWASRMQKLGAGVRIDALSVKDLTSALKKGTTDRIMKEKAAGLGEKIRSENGPKAAVQFITDHIHLAQERADIRAARARKDKPESPRVETKSSVVSGASCLLSRASSLTPRSSTPTRSSTLSSLLPSVLRSSTNGSSGDSKSSPPS